MPIAKPEGGPDDLEVQKSGAWWYVVNRVTGVTVCKTETKEQAQSFCQLYARKHRERMAEWEADQKRPMYVDMATLEVRGG